MNNNEPKRDRPKPPPGMVEWEPVLTEEDERILDKIWDKAKDAPVNRSVFDNEDEDEDDATARPPG